MEAIFLDFDGTLVDSEPLHWSCWAEAVAPLGISLSWATFEQHAVGITDTAFGQWLAAEYAPSGGLAAVQRAHAAKRACFRQQIASGELISEAVRTVLTELAGRYALALVTSSLRDDVLPALEAAGVARHFSATVFGDDVRRHKPDPEPYELAQRKLSVCGGPAFEDSEVGCVSAAAAGLTVQRVSGPADLVCRLRELVR